MLAHLVVFFSGFAAEGVCTLWVRAVGQGNATVAGIASATWAGLVLIGIEDSLRGGNTALSWVLGYGAGSYFVVKWGPRRKRSWLSGSHTPPNQEGCNERRKTQV